MPQHSFSSQRILPDIRLRHSAANHTRKRIPHLYKEVVKAQHVDLYSILAKSLRRIGGNFTTIHKAGLVMPHGKRVVGKSVLFEPYCQIMIFEFCVGVFSVCEGLGSIHHLLSKGKDGAAAPRVAPDDWIAALCSEFDPIGVHDLKANVRHTKEVRDKIHQDRIGARSDIDWHDFGYDKAFIPARDALQPLLRQFEDQVPKTTNLLI